MVPRQVIDYHLARLKDKRPDARLKAVRELELLQVKEADVMEALRRAAADDDDAVRLAAQRCVSAYLITQLNDSDARVRLNAVKDLQQMGSPDALEPLRKVFENDPDEEVRKAAKAAGRAIFLSSQKK